MMKGEHLGRGQASGILRRTNGMMAAPTTDANTHLVRYILLLMLWHGCRLLARIDKNNDGLVNEDEFTAFFSGELPRDPTDFDEAVKQFLEVAKVCQQKGEQRQGVSRANQQNSRGRFPRTNRT